MYQKITFKQMYTVFLAYQLPAVLNVSYGYTAYLIPQLRRKEYDYMHVEDGKEEWLASSWLILRPIGVLINVSLQDVLGRKLSMQIPLFLLSVSFALMSLANDVFTLLLTRIFNGIITGMNTSSVIYITEISTDEYRSLFLSVSPAFMAVYTGLSYVTMYFFNWRIAGIILAVYYFVIFLLVSTIPESPQWLVQQDRMDDAAKSLNWFQHLNWQQTNELLNKIKNSIADVKKPSLIANIRYISGNWDVCRVFIVFSVLTSLSCTCGYNLINNFTVDLFSGVQNILNSERLSLVFSAATVAQSAVLIVITSKFNLKTTATYCSAVMTVCALLLAAYCSYYRRQLVPDEYSFQLIVLQWAAVILIFVYTTFANIGAGEITWIVAPQLFPSFARGLLYGLLEIADMFVNLFASTLFSYFIYSHQLAMLHIVFAVSSFFTFVIILLFVPLNYSPNGK